MGGGVTKEAAATLFTDGSTALTDGRITDADMPKGDSPEEWLTLLFKVMDSENTGAVQPLEVRKWVEQLWPQGMAGLDELCSGDQPITQAQFTDVALRSRGDLKVRRLSVVFREAGGRGSQDGEGLPPAAADTEELAAKLCAEGDEITAAELDAMIREVKGLPTTKEQRRRVGRATFAAITPMVRARRTLKGAFALYDRDKTGKVMPEDLLRVMSSFDADLNMDEVMDMFNEIDTKHDGFIDFEEFQAAHEADDPADKDAAPAPAAPTASL